MARLGKERRGEIALMALKALKKKKGVEFSAEKLREDAKQLAEAVHIDEAEALDFAKDFMEELLDEHLQELYEMK